jgi:hypothetical protein
MGGSIARFAATRWPDRFYDRYRRDRSDAGPPQRFQAIDFALNPVFFPTPFDNCPSWVGQPKVKAKA